MPDARCGSSAPPPTIAKDQLLRVKDVAARLGCSIPNVNRLRKARKMPPAMKIGNLVRWSPEVIQKWLDEQGGAVGRVDSPSLMDRALASMEVSAEPFVRAVGRAFREHGERFLILEGEDGRSVVIRQEPNKEQRT